VKQIVGSTLKDDAGSSGSSEPVENFVATKPAGAFAQLYSKHQMPGGHVIMLGKGNEEAALQALRTYPGGMQVGGGVTPSNAKKYIDAGASHVIVTSYVFRDGAIDYARLNEMVATVGKDQLVLDLSCRRKQGGGNDYYVVTDRWQKYTNFMLSKQSLAELATYCDEFLVHGVDVEGMRVGILEELVTLLGEWSPIPVT
jgi:phosphoribosylformimino-5-aminoimidazole carboxamide ribotide isomerase